MRTIDLGATIRLANLTADSVLLAAMSGEDFARGHIPESRHAGDDEPRIERWIGWVARGPHTPLIVYGTGLDAYRPFAVALRLEDLGYQRVHLFVDGLRAWRGRGHIVAASTVPVR